MTNGPEAKIAESVVVDIPRHRDRATIINHPHYYPTRNHLVEFLVKRSKELSDDKSGESLKITEPVTVYPAKLLEEKQKANSSSEFEGELKAV